MSRNAIAIIPARYASTRFPGKPLAKETGKFLIQHVCEQVARARLIDRVIVATDDGRIAEAVESFGGECVMTRADHASGTDRVAEVARNLDCEVVVNVQGDEPEIEPAAVDRLMSLIADGSHPMATLACSFAALGRSGVEADPPESPLGKGGPRAGPSAVGKGGPRAGPSAVGNEGPGAGPSAVGGWGPTQRAAPGDPDCVKVAVANGRALYFSRSVIPFQRNGSVAGAAPLLHLGVYAYRRAFLLEIATWPPSPLERAEGLEQLRVLEHGHTIAVGVVERAAVGIDTPADYAAFVERYRSASSRTAVVRADPPESPLAKGGPG